MLSDKLMGGIKGEATVLQEFCLMPSTYINRDCYMKTFEVDDSKEFTAGIFIMLGKNLGDRKNI